VIPWSHRSFGHDIRWGTSSIRVVSDALAADRKATHSEVMGHAKALRRLANELGFSSVRLRDDGTVIIHSAEPGYRGANRLSITASQVVGAYVHVITDDVPGALSAQEL
jgi:hypothetical protein